MLLWHHKYSIAVNVRRVGKAVGRASTGCCIPHCRYPLPRKGGDPLPARCVWPGLELRLDELDVPEEPAYWGSGDGDYD